LHRYVVGLRAQYGVATAGGTTIERWQGASGPDFAALTSAARHRVRALRIGLVTRSAQREKEAASGHCEASMNKPELFGNAVNPDLRDWACYRYRIAVTVVPLRNFVWGLAP
jgi:type IV pilus assembly protein PilW